MALRWLLAALAAFAGRKPTTTRMRHQTLLLLRWLAILGQTSAILFVHFVLGHETPLLWCAIPIAASAWLNLGLAFRYPASKRLSDREAAGYMAFDILQLAILLYMTGGLLNPFAILLLAPATIAAATLSRGATIMLAGLCIVCVTILALGHWPLPWPNHETFILPRRYEFGVWVALVIGLLFSAIFAWRVAAEANRMSNALAATELVLAQEQRLSAVGALAAAAAHELGTPLATISVVARELERDVPQSNPLHEDVVLLKAQAERCREILNRLTREAQGSASLQRLVPLADVLEEIASPHRDMGIAIEIKILHEMSGADAHPANPVEIWRRPEIVHGLGNIIENAVDYAATRVRIEANATPAELLIRVIDDGPGFPKEVLDHLGEPFMTTRSRLADEEGADDGHNHGMGLGFFIAKTLLERTGAQVRAGNVPGKADLRAEHPRPGGAVVSVSWPAAQILGRAGGGRLAKSAETPKSVQ